MLACLHSDFVPTQLGQFWSRQKVKENAPNCVKQLHSVNDDQKLLLTDGTFIQMPRSGKVTFQKREFR